MVSFHSNLLVTTPSACKEEEEEEEVDGRWILCCCEKTVCIWDIKKTCHSTRYIQEELLTRIFIHNDHTDAAVVMAQFPSKIMDDQ